MSNEKVTCEVCPKEILRTDSRTFNTSKGKVLVCRECATAFSDNAPLDKEKPVTDEIINKRITLADLHIQYSNEETIAIKDMNGNELMDRLKVLESIVFEAKTKAAIVTARMRDDVIKNGGTARWDKPKNADPRKSAVLKAKKETLSKVEKHVIGLFSILDDTDLDNDDMIIKLSKKYDINEVRLAIKKIREN